MATTPHTLLNSLRQQMKSIALVMLSMPVASTTFGTVGKTSQSLSVSATADSVVITLSAMER